MTSLASWSGLVIDKGPAADDPVSRITLYRVALPLRRPLHHSKVLTSVLDEVVIVVTSASGAKGWAEVRGNGSYATGFDADDVLQSLGVAWERLKGTALSALGTTSSPLCNRLASALLDGAAHDAMARAAGVPLWRFLGGTSGEPVPTHAQIGAGTAEAARQRTEEAVQLGFGRVKVRIGARDPGLDLDRLTAVREAGGPGLAMVADVNGSWSLDTAQSMVASLADLGVAWLEQPTQADDLDALGKLRSGSPVPIWADESARDAESVRGLVQRHLVDGVHLKLEKCGTIANLREAVAVARDAGVSVAVGQMDQGRLGCALTTHLAASLPGNDYELWGFADVRTDVAYPLQMHDGAIQIPDGTGLGVDVTLDEEDLVMSLC